MMSGKAFLPLVLTGSLLILAVLFWGRIQSTFQPLIDVVDMICETQMSKPKPVAVETPSTSPIATSCNSNGIVGSYYESNPGMTPRFGVKFLDDTQVELYADGTKIGDTCTYTVEGDNIVITHACGTWHLNKQGDGFFNEELDWAFSKKM